MRRIKLIFITIIVGVYGQSSSKCVDHGFCFKITPPEGVNDPAGLYTIELEAPASIG